MNEMLNFLNSLIKVLLEFDAALRCVFVKKLKIIETVPPRKLDSSFVIALVKSMLKHVDLRGFGTAYQDHISKLIKTVGYS